MRVPASLIALPLFAGAAAGVLFLEQLPERLILAAAFAAILSTMAGAYFCAEDQRVDLLICVVLGSCGAGYAMGGAVTRDLLAPPLLRLFESHIGEAGEPVLVQGVLRDDAAVLPYGVVLTVDVESVSTVSGTHRTRGGARLVVGGAPDAAAILDWRA